MDIAALLATMRKPLAGEEVHYAVDSGTCQPVSIASVEREDDLFLALDVGAAEPVVHVMLDARFGYWDRDYKTYRRGTWHWSDNCLQR